MENNTPKIRLDLQRVKDICGATEDGRTKAHIILRYYDMYSNGHEEIHDVYEVTKPVVNIFMSAGHVDARLYFQSSRDQDLNAIWDILERCRDASNSVWYTPDEVEKGITFDGKPVYFPTVDIAFLPIGRETEYQVIGYNPYFPTLEPLSPSSPNPSVLHFLIDEEAFIVVDELDPVDVDELIEEIENKDH